MNKQHIVIIGGGFAGVNLSRSLANSPYYHITLVDRNNYNFFPPLIYQVASSYLQISNVTLPFRTLFKKQHNLDFLMGELERVDPANKTVYLSSGKLQYDKLVIAAGTDTNFFGNENLKKYALCMKNLDDALYMKKCLLNNFELAASATNEDEIRERLTILIAGGGPSGVELSGIMAEYNNTLFAHDFRSLAQRGFRLDIHLVDGSTSLLKAMSEKAQTTALKALEKAGVQVHFKKRVQDYNGQEVFLDTGEVIRARQLVWTTGVTVKTIEGFNEEIYGGGNRLLVDAYNRLIGYEDIYAIGDICLQKSDENYPDGHPQLAQVAIQQGKNLAKNLVNITKGKTLHPFSYYDKGTMAIVGKSIAVADLPKPKWSFSGFFAWLLWLFIHLMFLVSYRNRIRTFFEWMASYFSKDKPFRYIIDESKKINQ
ncbi:NAD(P)/FAD-dependent oxidoreductase [Olivibacter sitiensis]|uniref:NAD(P)/FAD-dependent oxidoreductase n=1 Tax=Olivibacter sitiensis TaxID=376470 RepID=UPI000411474B|nr:NAD(P)/FAD-dependent oxidoreductase [Olivibacter sitiensis]